MGPYDALPRVGRGHQACLGFSATQRSPPPTPQGVHMMFEGSPDRKWLPGEARVCKMVFIGKELDKEAFTEAFQNCLAKKEVAV